MKKENFILVSLKGDESKKLANSISNETCRKILNYLSDKESATESEISKQLKVPISTVHYNLQLLKENELVETQEFHYSKKGREVLHYSLANKMIIIAPKASDKFLDKLKSIIPVAAIVGLSGLALRLLNFGSSKSNMASPQMMMESSRIMKDESAEYVMMAAEDMAMDAPPEMALEMASRSLPEAVNFFNQSSAWWFLIGSGFTILVLIIWWFLRRKKI